MAILSEYVRAAMSDAEFKQLENSTFFGEVPGCSGVWANEDSIEDCRLVLQEVLEEWIVLKLRDHDALPLFSGIDLNKVVGEA